MIKATQGKDGVVTLTLDIPDRIAIRKLAGAYAIPFDAMLVGCINKGIDVIGQQVKQADDHDGSTDDHSQEETGG